MPLLSLANTSDRSSRSSLLFEQRTGCDICTYVIVISKGFITSPHLQHSLSPSRCLSLRVPSPANTRDYLAQNGAESPRLDSFPLLSILIGSAVLVLQYWAHIGQTYFSLSSNAWIITILDVKRLHFLWNHRTRTSHWIPDFSLLVSRSCLP